MEGCQHREHPTAALCNKLTAAADNLCPYHRLLADNHADDPTRGKPPQPARTYKTPRAYQE